MFNERFLPELELIVIVNTAYLHVIGTQPKLSDSLHHGPHLICDVKCYKRAHSAHPKHTCKHSIFGQTYDTARQLKIASTLLHLGMVVLEATVRFRMLRRMPDLRHTGKA